MTDLPKCILCGAEPIAHHNDLLHPFADCPMDGSRTMSADQWAALMGEPERAIVYEPLTVLAAKTYLANYMYYCQHESSGLYKPKLNAKMGEQQ